VDGLFSKAGVHSKMPDVMIERRLAPHVPEIYQWVFQRLAQECAQRGVRPVVIYRPAPDDFEGLEESSRSEMMRHAQAAKLDFIDLAAAFDSVIDRNTLNVAKWDRHTTARVIGCLRINFMGLVPLLPVTPRVGAAE
jgi:hypothetical protein